MPLSWYIFTLNFSSAVLTSAKGDKDALKAKLYANIMLGRNDDALQLIQSQKSIAADVVFEKAYCLFRTGRLDAALELLQGAEDEGSLHLSAIIHMRQRHTQAASAVYSSLAPKVKGNTQGAIELVREPASCDIYQNLNSTCEIPGTALTVSLLINLAQ